ncbi:MAG TPA: ribose-phosphate diphosphokinase [Rhizomicrobium sp.]|nr:ribose-phosphate diphosphokinase [Rhizomicrobium sp.]
MTPDLLFAMPGNEALTRDLCAALGCGSGALATRKFPDGETYLRYDTAIAGRRVGLVCTLNDPDSKIVSLLFAAHAARAMGAAKIGLVSPYLAYMRQDRSFQPGEAVTSHAMAALVSAHFDWLVTVDPHLHRTKSLAGLYTIPAHVVHAAPAIAAWIASHVSKPFLIGPDEESAQWIRDTAQNLHAPFATLKKERRGDRNVAVTMADIDIGDRVPVLLDDIVASGGTMHEAVKLLAARGFARPVCLAIHGIFAGGSDRTLAGLGADVVTTNSVPGPFAKIDLTGLIADGMREFAVA